MTSGVVVLLFVSFLTQCRSNVSLWGPGLSPDTIVLPARYFYVKISNGTSPEDYTASISGDGKLGPCRLWMNKLDCKDDHLIFRYRMQETCTNFRIDLKYKDGHIGESPYMFTGPILPEECHCPAENFDKWRSYYNCPSQIDRINADMKQFVNINMSLVLDGVLRNFNKPGSMSLCYYKIHNNRLSRKCYGQHVGFNMFSDAILLSVLRKVKIPDQSFFINLGDWPLSKKSITPPIPLFSWCGSLDTHDIVLPTYDLTESTLENMGRVMLDMLSVQGNIEKKWNEKIPKAFWRGRDSRRERLTLIDIARRNPSLFDAALTNYFFFRDEEESYGPKVPHISFFKFFDYKYQVTIDGTVAAYRVPYLLAGDSLVLKQDSPYYEHFYDDLIPEEHYIPFERDLSDLKDKILWAIKNDETVQNIAKKGREFARKYLMPDNIICYYALALNEWSKRLKTPFANVEGMEDVPLYEKDGSNCPCDKESPTKDEF